MLLCYRCINHFQWSRTNSDDIIADSGVTHEVGYNRHYITFGISFNIGCQVACVSGTNNWTTQNGTNYSRDMQKTKIELYGHSTTSAIYIGY